MYYITKLSAMAKRSNGADSVIAEFLLNNIEASNSMTLESIARDTDLSYATVCRFFKKLGVSGIRGFKKIAEDYVTVSWGESREIPDFDMSAMQNMSFQQIARNICSYSAGIVQHCDDAIDNKVLRDTIHILKQAESIHFVGLGTSAITAKYAYTKFFRLGIPCSVDEDVILSKMKASLLKKGSVLLAVSSSGRTKSIVEMAKIAKKNGATVISLCDFADSPLSNVSDVAICTTSRESGQYLDSDFPLIQGQITIVDILYLCYFAGSSTNSFQSTKETVKEDKLI